MLDFCWRNCVSLGGRVVILQTVCGVPVVPANCVCKCISPGLSLLYLHKIQIYRCSYIHCSSALLIEYTRYPDLGWCPWHRLCDVPFCTR